jgi:hypothetical protein
MQQYKPSNQQAQLHEHLQYCSLWYPVHHHHRWNTERLSAEMLQGRGHPLQGGQLHILKQDLPVAQRSRHEDCEDWHGFSHVRNSEYISRSFLDCMSFAWLLFVAVPRLQLALFPITDAYSTLHHDGQVPLPSFRTVDLLFIPVCLMPSTCSLSQSMLTPSDR